MYKGNIVLNYYDSLICEEDVQLLEGPFWLNDTIIGFYMEYLENEEYNNLNVCFIRPEVTQCLKFSPNVEVFLDPLKFRFKPYAVMTLNDCENPSSPGGSHWSLLVFSRDDLTFYHFDSSEGTNDAAARALSAKLSSYIDKKVKCEYYSARCLQQANSYDCGVFVMCNLEHVLYHIFKKRKLSLMEPISEAQVSRKRYEVKKLIINLYKREITQPKSTTPPKSDHKGMRGEGP